MIHKYFITISQYLKYCITFKIKIVRSIDDRYMNIKQQICYFKKFK